MLSQVRRHGRHKYRMGNIFKLCFSNASKNEEAVSVQIPDLRKMIHRYLRKDGHNDEDAEICADVLLYAELRGNNQGVVKLVSRALKANPKATLMLVDNDSPNSSKVNGGKRIGMCVVKKCVDIAIEKASSSNIGIVGCSNYATATGAIGYWARAISKAGYIGIVMSQCNELVAPHGSYEPIFGTNPIAFGIPLEDSNVIVFDMATSAEAYFGIMLASLANIPIRSDVAYDAQGNETSNPHEALKGALRVFDRGHKGSGLSLMIELLAGALTGASMQDKLSNENWGSLIIAISPNIFGSAAEFRKNASIMCDRVKGSKRVHATTEILLPGERGDDLEKENLKKGFVNIPRSLYDDILKFNNDTPTDFGDL